MTMNVPRMRQDDQALRLLAQMYARWFMRTDSQRIVSVYEQIRDVLYTAVNQQDAYEQLAYLAEMTPEADDSCHEVYAQARDSVAGVIQANGSADVLIVGETDGYRHLCLTCSRDEQNFQDVPFFSMQDRRPLLKPEVSGELRSAYSMCQICRQPINPSRLVLFVLAGTEKHVKDCQCGKCNRAGIASVLGIYECARETQQVLLPHLQQVIAPSKQKCIEQAIELCWGKGWYMFNKNSVFPHMM
jgi:hypothetical protein